ncbi:tubulin binding cofactor A [Myriangium duriaei CBS 260.36]|uniref:Tubulin-specific chaperone A n=1 Tax=Myriangium duriaei CBS 260.36 TaxID=1168546 RepID=A0A9P4MJY7_9PEZI|nr:tubulin binding cofactor A [Myriangium duriaei CBS 260.36]
MPAPSQLSIATGAVTRLVKEEASYHKEAEQQKVRIAKLEANNGDEYELRQEKQALDETHKVFPSLHAKIKDAVAKLEAQLVHALCALHAGCESANEVQEKEEGGETSTEEVTKAKEAVAAGKTAIRETA